MAIGAQQPPPADDAIVGLLRVPEHQAMADEEADAAAVRTCVQFRVKLENVQSCHVGYAFAEG